MDIKADRKYVFHHISNVESEMKDIMQRAIHTNAPLIVQEAKMIEMWLTYVIKELKSKIKANANFRARNSITNIRNEFSRLTSSLQKLMNPTDTSSLYISSDSDTQSDAPTDVYSESDSDTDSDVQSDAPTDVYSDSFTDTDSDTFTDDPPPQKGGGRGIDSFLKYFEDKYTYAEAFDSISRIPTIQVFINTVLTFYSNNDFVLNYSDKKVSNQNKITLVNSIDGFGNVHPAKAVALFDLADYMFSTMKRILKRAKVGFDLLLKGQLSFNSGIINHVDMLFYLVFMHVFPQQLRSTLRQTLRINKSEDEILNKCKGIIIEKGIVCDVTPNANNPMRDSTTVIDSVSDDESYFAFLKRRRNKLYAIDTMKGMGMLMKIMTTLRSFSDRPML